MCTAFFTLAELPTPIVYSTSQIKYTQLIVRYPVGFSSKAWQTIRHILMIRMLLNFESRSHGLMIKLWVLRKYIIYG